MSRIAAFLRRLRGRRRRGDDQRAASGTSEPEPEDVVAPAGGVQATLTPDLRPLAPRERTHWHRLRGTFEEQPRRSTVSLRRAAASRSPITRRDNAAENPRFSLNRRETTHLTLSQADVGDRLSGHNGPSEQSSDDEVSPPVGPTNAPSSATSTTDSRSAPPPGLEGAAGPDRSGLIPGVLAVICFVIVAATARLETAAVGRVLIPAGAVLAAVAFGQVLSRRHPDEPWLPSLLVVATLVKLAGSTLRFYALVGAEGFHGDASIYDKWGVNLFHAWTSGQTAPNPYTGGSAGTGWVRWFTGIEYTVFGPNMLNGFLIFGLLALIGSYLWYRAAAEAVPFLNRRLCFVLMFFAPSIAFWPSSIGKEALMQLGLGAVALGASRLLRQRVFQGVLVALPGGWLLWNVRAHLLAFTTFAAAAAYVMGRVRRGHVKSESTSLFRPVAMVLVALLAFFAASQAAQFLGMKDFSISSIEQELNQQTGRSSQGGSKVNTGPVSLTPLTVPQGMVKVLLQPFPWEVQSSLQILASLESAALGVLIIFRIRSIGLSLRRARATPFFIYCWTLLLLYGVAFSAVANYGLLSRQRSLALPALYVLVAAEPALAAVSEDGAAKRGLHADIRGVR
jgi:hypothetical protein